MNEPTGRASEPDVSIVIVTWNSNRWIGACLDALPRACEGLDWEVIVLDNASSDDSAATAEEHVEGRGEVIRSSENLGFAGGVNRAIEATSGRHLLLLNPDCVLDPGSVVPLVSACESDPAIAGSAPRLRSSDGVPQDRFQFRRLPTPGALVAELLFLHRLFPWNPATARYRCHDRDFSKPGDVEQPAFAAILMHSRVVRREGPLDESFYPAWFDDVDYCRRLRADGYRFVAVPEATGVHAGGASLESIHGGNFAVMWYRNMFRYARKWFSPGGIEFLRWGIMVGMLIRLAATVLGLGRFQQSRRDVLRGWVDVLKSAWKTWEPSSQSS